MPSYIEDFVSYSSSVCESPLHFHRWAALWSLAAACGRRIALPFHGSFLYPNVILILVGPAGLVQKSTVAGIAVTLLQDAGQANIYSDRLTRGWLARHMGKLTNDTGAADIVIHAPELRTCLSEQSLKEGIMETLTRMWDCPDEFGNYLVSVEHSTIRNVCLNMIGCSTRQWLITGIRADEMGGGFSARAIYVYGDTPWTLMEYSPHAPKISLEARDRCVRHINRILSSSGAFSLDKKAADAWNNKRRDTRKRGDIDERVRDYIHRQHVHSLKVAALLALSEGGDVIKLQHFEEAIVMLEANEPGQLKALQGVGSSKLDSIGDDVLRILDEKGGTITRGELTKTLSNRRKRILPDALTKLMQSLEEAGDISCDLVQQVAGKKPAIIYTRAKRES